MSRARTARRIAAAAAYGGGGIGLVGAGVAGLLLTEARVAAKRLALLTGEAPRADGLYGAVFGHAPEAAAPLPAAPEGAAPVPAAAEAAASGAVAADPVAAPPAAPAAPLKLCVVGDSTAAGFGVEYAKDTPGAVLSSALAFLAERPVRLVNVAVNGARSVDLEAQVTELLERVPEPDATLLFIGANDITHAVRPSDSVRRLSDAVRRLRATGSQVIVGTCPDLGTIEPVWQPLRWLAQRASRQLAAAQTIVTIEQGGRTVSLGDLLGSEFRGRPEMFARDRYHPSVEGYATAAMAVLPALAASLALWPEDEPDVWRGPAVLPVAQAAAEAAAHGGTEVSGTAVSGAETGPRGRWAALRQHRLRLREFPPLPKPAMPHLPPFPNLAHLGRRHASHGSTLTPDTPTPTAAGEAPAGATAVGQTPPGRARPAPEPDAENHAPTRQSRLSRSCSSHDETGDSGTT